MEEFFVFLTAREQRLRERAELAAEEAEWAAYDARRCPRCRMGRLDGYAGVCGACGYPEFRDDEPCCGCDDGNCDECEYAKKLRLKLQRW